MTHSGIYSGTTHPFSFLWQTSKNTEPGDYTITMTSTVPDEKCDQTNMVPVTNVINVHIAESFDGCISQINNFQAGAPSLNSPMSFTGTKLNSYQDWTTSGTNCETKGTLNSETYFDTAYVLEIKNRSNDRIIDTQTGVLPKNSQSNTPVAFSLSWTPRNAGSYEANLTIQSTGDVTSCNGKALKSSSSVQFQLGRDNDNDKYYDIEGDCDDSDPLVNPAAIEICNQKDDNCNNQTDENACSQITYYCDYDHDGLISMAASGTGFGVISIPSGCAESPGTDCDDTNPNIKAEQTYYRDIDKDGYGNSAVSIKACPQNKPTSYLTKNVTEVKSLPHGKMLPKEASLPHGKCYPKRNIIREKNQAFG